MMFPLPFPQSGCSPHEGASGILKMGCELVMPHPLFLEQSGSGCGSVAGLHPLSWVQRERLLLIPCLSWTLLPRADPQTLLHSVFPCSKAKVIRSWGLSPPEMRHCPSSLPARSRMPGSPSAWWLTTSPSGDSGTGDEKCPCKTGRLKGKKQIPLRCPESYF